MFKSLAAVIMGITTFGSAASMEAGAELELRPVADTTLFESAAGNNMGGALACGDRSDGAGKRDAGIVPF